QLNTTEYEKLLAQIEGLSRAVADVITVDDVEPGLRKQFGLTADSLAVVQLQVEQGQVRESWTQRVRALDFNLRRNPLLKPTEYQIEAQAPSAELELRAPDKAAE